MTATILAYTDRVPPPPPGSGNGGKSQYKLRVVILNFTEIDNMHFFVSDITSVDGLLSARLHGKGSPWSG